MGNAFSSVLTREDVTRVSGITNMASSDDNDNTESHEFHDAIDEVDDSERVKAKEAEMEEFRRQLKIKREQRREILDRHKTEKRELELCLENERKAKLEAYESNKLLRELLIQNNIDIPENLQGSKENSIISDTIVNMKEEFDKLKSHNNKLRRDLADCNVALQGAYSDIADLQMQNTESIKQINALKEVVAASKTMLGLRENQLGDLKQKLSEIERSLADREANMLSADLRKEYERQLLNIRALRTLYEERARLAEVSRQGLIRELEEQKELKQAEIDKGKELLAKVQELEAKVDELQEIVSNKNNQIYTCQDETRGLKAEMSAVNKLFSQVLLGYKSQQDLDKLVHRLEENHGILTHMAENENDSEASTALPKLLLEIVSQVDEGNEDGDVDANAEQSTSKEKTNETETPVNSTAEEIVQNLPKVWRVLIELLSHQAAPDDNVAEKVTTCYKTVETKTGPVQVPSVSQTYIRLKDLIVEKLGLVKEVNRMKQLNTHLETRLEEQERRLCLVTNELSKTWHVVGRLRRHHHQLHTHEKILKYELQQKRKLLNELKEELEYCREKWDQAREKNTQSEKDWRKLRAEFSGRKTKLNASFNNSAESGYSDERPSEESSESNDESEYVTESLIRSKKKLKKSDSSTDRNLAAEREDPASDMLDVADLPLDTHDGDEHNDVSDSCNSESLLKSERVCETEDEVGDITHDSCTEDLSAEHSQRSENSFRNENNEASSTSAGNHPNVPTIDPAAILQSIREQNERLATKDKKLEKLEKSSAALLQQTQITAKMSDQINNTLDHLLNRPSSSNKPYEQEMKAECGTNLIAEDNISPNDLKNIPTTSKDDLLSLNADFKCILEDVTQQNDRLVTEEENLLNSEKDCIEILDKLPKSLNGAEQSEDKISSIFNATTSDEIESRAAILQSTDESSSSTAKDSVVDFKAILENVKKQNERLALKDDRLRKLEIDCSEVVNNISKTLSTGEEIIQKLDNLRCSNSESNSSCRDHNLEQIETDMDNNTVSDTLRCEETEKSEATLKETMTLSDTNNAIVNEPSTSNVQLPRVDFSVILENVRKQNERLAAKDARLEKLETGCSEVVKTLTDTLATGEHLTEKLDNLHDSSSESKETDLEKDTSTSSSRDSSEPSTSSEVDHEALFAARDLRLRRLEEQTKSLVNKVNKTNDKGVKIHYKLEELHNIYGSENSRASTPSENEDRDETNDRDTSNDNDTESQEHRDM